MSTPRDLTPRPASAGPFLGVVLGLAASRALDGTQEQSWGDYSASWTYHPDDGLNIVIAER